MRASHGLSAAENAAVPSFRSEAPSLALARRMGCCMPTNLQVLPLVTHGISMGTGAFWRRDALPPASPGQCRAMAPFASCAAREVRVACAVRGRREEEDVVYFKIEPAPPALAADKDRGTSPRQRPLMPARFRGSPSRH